MKVYTELVYNADGALIKEESYEYEGPVALCKGEGTSKEQLKRQNDLQEKAFNMQKEQLQKINDAFSGYLSGNVGLDPNLMAMLQSQFQNQTASTYNDAGKAVRSAILARGGNGQTPVSGTDIRGLLGLEGMKANTLSQGTLGLGITNLQQMLTNKFNAGSLMSGNAATLNSPISTFGAGANNALNQYVQASNSGFGATFSRMFGGMLGQTLGTGFGNNILKGLAGGG